MLTGVAEGLSARGHRVHVVTSRLRADDAQAELLPEEVVNGVSVHRIWSTRFGRAALKTRLLDYLSFHWSARRVVASLAQFGDVVVAKTDPPLLGVNLQRGLGQYTHMNWVQDVFPELAQRTGVMRCESRLYAWLLDARNRNLLSAAGNVVLGDSMLATLKRAAPHARLTVIPNWSGDLRLESGARGSAGRSAEHDVALTVPAAGLSVMYAGNLGRVHDFDTVLDAAQLLSAAPSTAVAPIRFELVGDGAQRASLERAVATRNLTNVGFRDPVPESGLPDMLASADVHLVTLTPDLEGLVTPSKYYGILAVGRPVAYIGGADADIAAEVVAEGAGIATPAGAPAQLASALLALAADAPRVRQMGERARGLFLKRYRLEHCLDSWEQLLAQI
ncbi:MAG: glycosyltransferase family 4 protein [Pseudomonadota bacterium]